MPTYRDTWADTPGVVAISETPLTEEGVLEDALLLVLDATPQQVRLADERGAALTFNLPAAALGGDYVKAGIDLQTEQIL